MQLAIPRPGREPLQANFEAAAQPRGLFVLAPGRGYHMGLPLMVSVARELVSHDFHVLHFDWEFFVQKSEPSEGLAQEIAQIDATVRWARAHHPQCPLFLFGKSLGSRASLRWSLAHAAHLAGLALCTLPLHASGRTQAAPEAMQAVAKDLNAVACPLWIACGDRDPLSDLEVLHALVSACQPPPSLFVAAGDHCFEDPGQDRAWAQKNIDQVAQALVSWADRIGEAEVARDS